MPVILDIDWGEDWKYKKADIGAGNIQIAHRCLKGKMFNNTKNLWFRNYFPHIKTCENCSTKIPDELIFLSRII